MSNSDDDSGVSDPNRLSLQRDGRFRHQSYWMWPDRHEEECGNARDVLTEAGIQSRNLRSRDEDPPDCEAIIDGCLCGIELTHLIHESTRARSIRALREKDQGKVPSEGVAYLEWSREGLLGKIQEVIDKKDQPAKVKGGPYSRYILIITTDEFSLDKGSVATMLHGAEFEAQMITDVFLALSYHPAIPPMKGHLPIFKLTLTGRIVAR